MDRRHILAALAMLAACGCGLVQTGLTTIQTHQPGAVTRTFDATVARVMMNVLELEWDEIVMQKEYDFALKSSRIKPGTKFEGTAQPVNGEIVFDPEQASLDGGRITGKTKDGRLVTVWLQPRDNDRKTEITVLIGKHGDAEMSGQFLDKIADRLAHPPLRTPEEIERRKVRVPVYSSKEAFEAAKSDVTNTKP